VISIVLFTLFLAKLFSLIYFASRTNSFKATGQISDAADIISGQVVFDEVKNDDQIISEGAEPNNDDDIIEKLKSDSLDEALDEPVQYDDDTIDDSDEEDDENPQDMDSEVQTEQAKSEVLLQVDEKTDERELEEKKKVPEPVEAESPPVKQVVKTLKEGVDFVKENGVIVATDDNFQDLVRHYKYTFIDFYAEWCGWCKKLEPEFAEAARIMKKINPDVGFIKINLTKNKGIKRLYRISKFPTVVLFNRMVKKTTSFKYERKPLVMVKWIQKMLKEQGQISPKK